MAARVVSTTIFLVRHAAHADVGRRLTGRASGLQLTEAGERQAKALGTRLSGEGLDAIQTSPRARARATAEEISRQSGAPVELAPALDEIDFGDWTGRSFEELAPDPLWREWNEARGRARPPNGESMVEAADRAAAHLAEIARERPGGRIAIVSHCDILRAVVARCLGLPLDNMLRFDIAPASVSRIEVGDWGERLTGLNEIPAPHGGAPE